MLEATQGIGASWDVVIRDSYDQPYTGYTGTETLAGKLYGGDDQAPVLTFTPLWLLPSGGLLIVRLTSTQTATIDPGDYNLSVFLADHSAELFRTVLRVDAYDGGEAPPSSYISFHALTQFAPRADRLLSLGSDDSGYARQLGQASRELDQMILLRYNPQPGRSRRYVNEAGTAAGPYLRYAMGPGGVAAPTRQAIAALLATDALLINADLLECVAFLALEMIYAGEPGQQNPYAAAAPAARAAAEAAFRRARVEIDTDDDQVADLRIAQDVTYLT